MAEFEARAVITADMSGFISASRAAARAAGTFASALDQLNNRLADTSRMSRAAADAYAPLVDAASRFDDANRRSTSAGQALRQEMQASAESIDNAVRAYAAANDQTERNTRSNRDNADSVRSLAQQYSRINQQLEEVQTANQGNFTSTRNVAAATATYTAELARLEQRRDQLSESERQAYERTLDLLEAQRTHRAVMRETGLEMNLQTGALQRTAAELETMGRRFNTLTTLQGRFAQLQANTGVLTREQATSYDAVNQALGVLQQRYSELDARQQARVDRARAEAQATQLLAEANRVLAQNAQASARAAREQAQAATASSTEINRMARQLESYTDIQRRYQALQQGGTQLNAQQAASFQQVNTALQQTQAVYNQLATADQARVTAAREQIASDRALADSKRSLVVAEREAAEAGRATAATTRDQTISNWGLRSAIGDLDGNLASLQQSLLQVGQALATAFTEQDVAIGQLARITQETDVFVGNLVDSFRRMSTEIPLAFSELATIGQFGAQVGISNDRLVEFTRTVALFAATTDVGAEQAATMFARVQQLTGLSQGQIPNMGAAISALGSSSAATESQILRLSEQIATVAQSSGLSAQSVFGLSSALASLGVRPELARGALQRTLFEIEQAAQGASERTQGLADSMGLTVEEMVSLRNSMSREDFFFTFIGGLQSAAGASGDLNTVLRDIGFRNVQDIQVLAALGQNWGFVSDQLGIANEEFERNDFLQRESQRLFERTTFQVQMLGNSFQNLGARIVEFLAPGIAAFANWATEIVNAAAASDFLVASLAGLAVVASVALALTGLARVVSFAAEGFLALQTLWVAMRARALGAAAATGVLTASTTASAVAARSGTAAILAYQTGIVASAAGTTALSRAQLALATSTAAATGALRAAGAAILAFTRAHPVILTLTVAIVGLTAAYAAFAGGAQRAEERLLRLQQANFDAAGGINALTTAIQADTQAWNRYGDSVAFNIRSFEDVGGAAERAALSSLGLEMRTESLRGQLDVTGRSAQEFGSSVEGGVEPVETLAGALGNTALATGQLAGEMGQVDPQLRRISAAASDTQYAVGAMTLAWAQSAFQASLINSEFAESAEIFTLARDRGVDFGAALVTELYAAGAGADYLRQEARAASDELLRMAESQGFLSTIGEVLFGGPAQDLSRYSRELNEQANALEGISLQMDIQARAAQFANSAMIDLGNGTSIAVSELGDLNDESALLNATLDGTTLTVESLRSAFTGVVDPAATWSSILQEAGLAADATGSAFDDLGGSALPEFNRQMAASERQLIGYVDDLLLIAAQAGPDVAQALLEMGDAGISMGDQLADAFNTGNIDDFDAAVSRLGLNGEAAINSLSESFARISGATGELREEAQGVFEDLFAEFQAGDIDFTEFITQLNTQLDEVLGPVQAEITAALDDTQLAADMSTVREILEAWARENGLNIPVEDIDTSGLQNDLDGLVDSFRSAQGAATFEVSLIAAALRSIGTPLSTAFANDLDSAIAELGRGELSVEQFRERVEDILGNANAALDLDINDQQALEDTYDLLFGIEESARNTSAVVTPAVMGTTAMGEMDVLTGNLVLKGQEADPTVTPSVNRPPAERQMGELVTKTENDATAAKPTIIPVAATTAAITAMRALVAASRDMSAAARPTITPIVATGPAIYAMRVLVSALRSAATTIYIPVVPYQAGSVSRGALVRADGGWIHGPGGPRDDRIPAWLSNGEFVVNARAARIWGSVLEGINSGVMPDMALRNASRSPQIPTSSQAWSSSAGSTPMAATASDLMRAVSASPAPVRQGPQFTVYNTYPQAEPTSVTINRAMTYGQLLEGASL